MKREKKLIQLSDQEMYEKVWKEEAEWARIEIMEYKKEKQKKLYDKLINKIKKLFGGIEID